MHAFSSLSPPPPPLAPSASRTSDSALVDANADNTEIELLFSQFVDLLLELARMQAERAARQAREAAEAKAAKVLLTADTCAPAVLAAAPLAVMLADSHVFCWHSVHC